MVNKRKLQNIAVISDFDGTISTRDTNELLLQKYGNKVTERIKKNFIAGTISTKEVLQKYFQELSINEEEYTQFLINNIEIDKGFKQFYLMLNKFQIPFAIVSGGFVNAIVPLLKKENIAIKNIYANRLIFQKEKIKVKFLHEIEQCEKTFGVCGNCKVKYLNIYKNKKWKVVFIGDGLTDRCIAEKADVVCAKDDLEKYCLANKINHHSFKDFADISERVFNLKWGR